MPEIYILWCITSLSCLYIEVQVRPKIIHFISFKRTSITFSKIEIYILNLKGGDGKRYEREHDYLPTIFCFKRKRK